MDQARWLVVFSVVVVMIATLSLLHRYSRSNDSAIANTEASGTQNRSESSQQVVHTSEQKFNRQGRFKYSAPPRHVFSIENSSTFVEENKEFKDKGQILP